MKAIRTAIVGCGKVGHLHAQALQALPQADFVAASSRSASSAQAFADQYGIQPYTDVEQMLTGSTVEAVIICTPHPAHAEPAVIAAQHGVHILVEKPLAASLADCDRIIRAARDAGVKLGTVSQRRFYPSVQRVRTAIDSGKIGQPALGTAVMLGWRDQAYYESDPWRGTWDQEGGGVLVNQAPHPLDLLQWFMGPIREIFGYHANLNHPYIEVEDTAVAALRFESGALGNIIVSNSQKPGIHTRVHVHGTNGASVGVQLATGAMFVAGMSAETAPPYNDLWTVPGEEDQLDMWRNEDEAHFNAIDAEPYYIQQQVQDFLGAIIDDRQPLITGEDGRRTVEIFTAIYRAQRTGKPVTLPLDG